MIKVFCKSAFAGMALPFGSMTVTAAFSPIHQASLKFSECIAHTENTEIKSTVDLDEADGVFYFIPS